MKKKTRVKRKKLPAFAKRSEAEEQFAYKEIKKLYLAKLEFKKQMELYKEMLYKEQVAILMKEAVQEQFNKHLKDILDE